MPGPLAQALDQLPFALAQAAPLAPVDPPASHGELFYWPVWLATVLVTGLCVLVHFEAVRLLIHRLNRVESFHRLLLPSVILALLATHLIEIFLYALAFVALNAAFADQVGGLAGQYDGSLADTVYFSAAVYTTVGFGDIIPTGPLRLLVAAEALTGLVLITWSASFTFLIMQRYFRKTLEPREDD